MPKENKEKSKYEHHSHYHCWQQTGENKPACGQPLDKHTQCCLCDLPTPPIASEVKENCACHEPHISKMIIHHKEKCHLKGYENCEICHKEVSKEDEMDRLRYKAGTLSSHPENWEKLAAEISLKAHKKAKNYAEFSEIIYQGLSQAITTERNRIVAIVEERVSSMVDSEEAREVLWDLLTQIKK